MPDTLNKLFRAANPVVDCNCGCWDKSYDALVELRAYFDALTAAVEALPRNPLPVEDTVSRRAVLAILGEPPSEADDDDIVKNVAIADMLMRDD